MPEETVNQETSQETPVQEDTVEETPVEETSTEETPSEPEEENEEMDPELAEAIQLLHALKDPKVAPVVIRNLAQQVGLLENKTQAEQAKVVKDLRTAIKEQIADGFIASPDQFADLIERAIEEKVSGVRAEAAEKEYKQQLSTLQSETDKFISANKISPQEQAAINKLSQTILWNGDLSTLQSYLGTLLFKVRHEEGEKARATAKVEKINKNLTSTKVKNIRGSEQKASAADRTYSSPREAIEAAMRELETASGE